MNKTNELLESLKEKTGLQIINKSNQGIPLFDIPYRQPFNFGLEISYNGIKSMCSFELHFPSKYIKAEEIEGFGEEVSYIIYIIDKLNKALKEDYSHEWVKQ